MFGTMQGLNAFVMLCLFATPSLVKAFMLHSITRSASGCNPGSRTVRLDTPTMDLPVSSIDQNARVFRWLAPHDPLASSSSSRIVPLVDKNWPKQARETWRWCTAFVVPYHLCPWAAASVQTPGAVSIYLIDCTTKDIWGQALEEIAQVFWENVSGPQESAYDASASICFVVDTSSQWINDFAAFNDHYEDLLDNFLNDDSVVADHVMWAPFHPQWSYGGLELDDGLHVEKQSPYPTVSMVAQHVLDQAGPQATQRIADTNERTLRQFDLATWRKRYKEVVLSGTDSE